ncbi:hypothetical protein [Streptomyces sp. NPDC059224]
MPKPRTICLRAPRPGRDALRHHVRCAWAAAADAVPSEAVRATEGGV